MVAASVVLPLSLHQKAWIEAGIACGACWLVLVGFVAACLYSQPEIEDDNPTPKARTEWGGVTADGVIESTVGCAPDGCLILLGLILVVLVLVFLFEFIVPALIIALFWPLQTGLRALIARHPECADRLGPSIGWAAAWATLVVGPITAIVCALFYVYKP